MNWATIRLELARTDDFPAGSVSRGYVIRAPLTDDGLIDVPALVRAPSRATVRRFWSNEPDESGHVVRMNGHWVLCLEGKPERLIPGDAHFMEVGRDVPVVGDDGKELPFRVASVRQLGRF